MQPLATTAQMRALDRIAIQERGIPSLELMEHAAQAVTEAVQKLLGDKRRFKSSAIGVIFGTESGQPLTPEEEREMEQLKAIAESCSGPRVAVFCGPGNNGGDGIAAARLLLALRYEVRAFLVGDRAKTTSDARAMEEKLTAAGGLLEPYDPNDRMTSVWLSTCDCMVDALFGVGLSRPVGGVFLDAIRRINHCRAAVVSCDIPSGVNGDTGEIMGEAVRATFTVTFSYAKPGLYLNEGRAYSGKVRVEQIGIPRELGHAMIDRQPERVEVIPDYAHLVLSRRPRTAHKGDFGKVFILAGSEGYTGAPVLAANAAVRVGAGLVFLGVPREIYPIVAVKCDEAMPFPLPEEYDKILEKAKSCDAALIGPGLGRKPETEELVLRMLADLDIPVVLDADGINALSGHIDILDKRSAPTVLTPHDGEFQRLTGCALPIRDRLAAARDFAKAHGCVLVLKGHGTVTAASEGRAIVNTTGNPGMAKGGSGDVLAGMLAGFLGQKHLNGPHTDLAERTAAVVWYHGLAGDRCAAELGEYGMTPTDMIRAIPQVLRVQEEQDGKF